MGSQPSREAGAAVSASEVEPLMYKKRSADALEEFAPTLTGQGFIQAMASKKNIQRYIFQKPTNPPTHDFQPEDCFLSHRGPDTKLDLVVPISRMMNSLYDMSFFVDCEPTNMLTRAQAKSTSDVIAQSIWACKVIVVFLSPKFHESEWCLKELYTALYRRETDPSLQAVHIVYCDGCFAKSKTMPEYLGLRLDAKWGTEFKEGTHLHEFASNQLHNVLYQLVHGSTDGIQPNDAALMEWRKVCRHRFGIPPKLKYFMGREDKLLEITSTLENYPSAAITASGVGGAGKTQLVVSWVDQNLSRYFLVVWIRAEQDLTLKQDLATFGEQELGLHFNDKDDLEMRARKAMQAIKNRSSSSSPALFIFDNAKSYKGLLDQDWIPPPGSHCQSIVTTRDSSSCSDEEQVKVGPLDESSSLAIIEYFLQRKLDTTNERPKALDMLQSFDFLPLAIVNFAVFAKKFGLDDAIEKIQQVMEKAVYAPRSYQGQHRESVHAVLEAQLDDLDEGARTMLEYLSVLAPENVPLSLLRSLFEKDGNTQDYHAAMEQLMERAIVLAGGRADMVNTHRLFQSLTIQTAQNVGRLESCLDMVAGCLVEFVKGGFDETGNHDRKSTSVFYAHCFSAVRILVRHQFNTENMGRLCHLVADVNRNEAHSDMAMVLYQAAVDIFGNSSFFNVDSHYATVFKIFKKIAKIKCGKGQYEEALKLCEHSLAPLAEYIGKGDPDYADVLLIMAEAHEKQDQPESATALRHQALAIYAKAVETKYSQCPLTISSMARVHSDLGHYNEAILLYEKVLAIRGGTLGRNHCDFACTLTEIGVIREELKQYHQAMEVYKQALEIEASVLGRGHLHCAITLSSMAGVHFKQGQYVEALKLYQQALIIRCNALGMEHPTIASTLKRMALIFLKQDQFSVVLELCQRALHIESKAFGKTHPEYISTLEIMSWAEQGQGNHDSFLQLCQEAKGLQATIALDMHGSHNQIDAPQVFFQLCNSLRDAKAGVWLILLSLAMCLLHQQPVAMDYAKEWFGEWGLLGRVVEGGSVLYWVIGFGLALLYVWLFKVVIIFIYYNFGL